MPDAASGAAGFNPNEIRDGILSEIDDLKATVQAFGWDAIKNGGWFNQFLHACLSSYHERVMRQGGVAYLRGKYPGLPTEAVAGKLCALAEQMAGIAGSLSGVAASGAVLTAGAGIPVAISAVMAEVLFTVRLQLRLVYDLHLLYGIPIDGSDPEDLMGIFAVVYGVKVAEVGGITAKALGPEVMRAQLYRLIHGNTKLIQQAVSRVLGPRIARNVTQKAILKTAVPVAGVAISAGWNYTATKLMGSRVRQEVRAKALLREETLRLQKCIGNEEAISLAIIEGLIALALADKDFSDLEKEVYLTFLRQLSLTPEQLKVMASKVHADLDEVLAQLRSIADEDSRKIIGRCFCLIAASDGSFKDPEKQILIKLLSAMGQDQQLEVAEELCARYRKEEGLLGEAMGTVSDALTDAVSGATESVGSALGWMKGKLGIKDKEEDASHKDNFSAGQQEAQCADILQAMAELDVQLAMGDISLEEYKESWTDLEKRLSENGKSN